MTEFYETVIIDDKKWFICNIDDCGQPELYLKDMLSHVSSHCVQPLDQSVDQSFNPTDGQPKRKPVVQMKPKSTPKVIESINTCQSVTEDQDLDTDMISRKLKCRYKGCGKTFGFLKAYNIHQNKHQMKIKDILKNFSSLKPNKSQPFVHQIRNKYFKVHKICDKSIHRSLKKSHMSDKNYRGFQSLKDLGDYYTKSIIEGKKYYFCAFKTDYIECLFKTNRTQHMARHLNSTHFRNRKFKCTVKGCHKVYYNPTTLRQHELNHNCGFGIENGKLMASVCGNRTLNRFRKYVLEGDQKYRVCTFMDCPFRTLSRSTFKVHIHNQHICPFRIRYTDPITGKEVHIKKIIKNMNEMNRKYDCNEINDRVVTKNETNFHNNSGSQGSDDIVVIEDRADESNGASEEFTRFLADNNVLLDYKKRTFDRCSRELATLVIIRPYFRRAFDTKHRFLCKKCEFKTSKLSDISIHLRIKHFIQ